MIMHTDQGSEYTAGLFRAACQRLGIHQSMGRVGSALDNAAIESWHSTLEFELRRRRCFASKTEARAAVAAWIENYNLNRRHSACQMLAPVAYEQLLTTQQQEQEEQEDAAVTMVPVLRAPVSAGARHRQVVRAGPPYGDPGGAPPGQRLRSGSPWRQREPRHIQDPSDRSLHAFRGYPGPTRSRRWGSPASTSTTCGTPETRLPPAPEQASRTSWPAWVTAPPGPR